MAKKGKRDKKLHQVDVHVYRNHSLVAVIERKSYLYSCYYVS